VLCIDAMDLLADKVVSNTEQTNYTSPSSNELACQLTLTVLPVRANSKNTRNNRKPDRIA